MTKEALEARVNELKRAAEQTIANYNVIMGAMDECLNWLKTLEENKAEKPAELTVVK